MSTSIGLGDYSARNGNVDLGGFTEPPPPDDLLFASPVRGTEFLILEWMDIDPISRGVMFLTGNQNFGTGSGSELNNLFAVVWTGEGWGALIDSVSLPSGMSGLCVKVHPDGDFIAVATDGSTFVVYPWDGASFGVPITQAKPGAATTKNCAWSKDGLFLAFTDNRNQAVTPDFCHVYPWSGVFGVRITGPAAAEQNENGTDTVEFAPGDTHILFGDDGGGIATDTTVVRTWNWNSGGGGSFGTVVTRPVFNFNNRPENTDQSQFGGRDIAFHPGGGYVALMHILDLPIDGSERDALDFTAFPWDGSSTTAPYGTRVPSPPDTLQNINISQEALAWSPDGLFLTLARKQAAADSEFIRTYFFDPVTGLFGPEGEDHITYIDEEHNRLALESEPLATGLIKMHTGIIPGGCEDLFYPNAAGGDFEQAHMMAMTLQGQYEELHPVTLDWWHQTYGMTLAYTIPTPPVPPPVAILCDFGYEYDEIIDPAGTVFRLSDGVARHLMVESGTGLPPIRYLTQRAPYVDGEQLFDYRLQPRTVRQTYRHRGRDRRERWELHGFLLDAIRPNRQVAPWQVVDTLRLRKYLPDGSRWDLNVMPDLASFGQRQRVGWDEWSLQEPIRFIAFDPAYYDPDETVVTLSDLDDQLEFGDAAQGIVGGVDFEPGERIWFGGGLTATVAYDGNWFAFPVIEITGPITNPIITNDAIGERIALDYALEAGEVVTIDTREASRSVVSGLVGSITGLTLNPSTLATFRLEPEPTAPDGQNPIRIFGTDITDATAVTIRYHRRKIALGQ
jgi:hypothetical protein